MNRPPARIKKPRQLSYYVVIDPNTRVLKSRFMGTYEEMKTVCGICGGVISSIAWAAKHNYETISSFVSQLEFYKAA